MSTGQTLYSIEAALDRVENSGDDVSRESEDDDGFTARVTPQYDATDSSDSTA